MSTATRTALSLDKEVAFLKELGYGSVFGAGSPRRPLFPAPVVLPRGELRPAVITHRVEEGVRSYLREQKMPHAHVESMVLVVRAHLRTAGSGEALLRECRRLVAC